MNLSILLLKTSLSEWSHQWWFKNFYSPSLWVSRKVSWPGPQKASADNMHERWHHITTFKRSIHKVKRWRKVSAISALMERGDLSTVLFLMTRTPREDVLLKVSSFIAQELLVCLNINFVWDVSYKMIWLKYKQTADIQVFQKKM